MSQARPYNHYNDSYELYERRYAYAHHMNNLAQVKSAIDTSAPKVAPRIAAYQQRAAAKRAAQLRLEEKNLRLLRQNQKKKQNLKQTPNDYFQSLTNAQKSKYGSKAPSVISHKTGTSKYQSPRKFPNHVKMNQKLEDNFNIHEPYENENEEELFGSNLEEGMKVTDNQQHKLQAPTNTNQSEKPKSLINKSNPSVKKPIPPSSKPSYNRKFNRKNNQNTGPPANDDLNEFIEADDYHKNKTNSKLSKKSKESEKTNRKSNKDDSDVEAKKEKSSESSDNELDLDNDDFLSNSSFDDDYKKSDEKEDSDDKKETFDSVSGSEKEDSKSDKSNSDNEKVESESEKEDSENDKSKSDNEKVDLDDFENKNSSEKEDSGDEKSKSDNEKAE